MEFVAGPPGEAGQEPTPDLTGPGGETRSGGAKLYFVSSVVAQASALLRYVVLAHLLGPTQLGLATTLVVTAAFFDQVSDTGGDRFIVQDRHGGDPEVQKLIQTTYVLRGVATALLLIAVSTPVSMLYHQPRLVTGLCFLGISPLIAGFLHMDTRRTQRWMDFRFEAISSIVGEIAGLIAVFISAWMTRYYSAIIFGLVTRSLFTVVTSHIVSKRPYALGWSKDHVRRMAGFSAPLIANGFMLFIGSQADRVIVGNQLGVKSLGLYSAILLLVFYPTALLIRFMFAMYIPQAAAGRDDEAIRNQVSERLGGLNVGLATCIAVGFAVVAPLLVPFIYGERFRQTSLLIGLIGILQTTRFLITWPTAMALATGRSRSVLIANSSRLFVLPGAFLGLHFMGGLEGVVVGFICGELASIVVSLILLNRILRTQLAGFDRLGLFILVGAAIIAWNLFAPAGSPLTLTLLSVGSAVLAATVLRREWRTLREALPLLAGFLRSLRRGPKSVSTT
jgi:O-antigen/teichoic acid export membrane protein